MQPTCLLSQGISQGLGTLFSYFLKLQDMVTLKARLLLLSGVGFLGRQFVSLLSGGMPLEVGGKPAGGQL